METDVIDVRAEQFPMRVTTSDGKMWIYLYAIAIDEGTGEFIIGSHARMFVEGGPLIPSIDDDWVCTAEALNLDTAVGFDPAGILHVRRDESVAGDQDVERLLA